MNRKNLKFFTFIIFNLLLSACKPINADFHTEKYTIFKNVSYDFNHTSFKYDIYINGENPNFSISPNNVFYLLENYEYQNEFVVELQHLYIYESR